MKAHDTLKRDDRVKVAMVGPKGNLLYESTDSGYHSLDEAIQDTIDNAGTDVNPEDCVFEVTNQTTGISHQYRLNAHGNLKLIV